jgi:DNA polymerase III alpha subunit
MYTDEFGQYIFSEKDLCNLFLKDPEIKFNNPILVNEDIDFGQELSLFDLPERKRYTRPRQTKEEFDHTHANDWYMPESYKTLDIAKWVLEQCKSDAELQRAGEELILYQERDLFVLLRYLKYFVDTLRSHKIVWGVGRGSSIASFVLYLIGVHRVNSLYYDLSVTEFLK